MKEKGEIMDIMEVISDAITYPFRNLKAVGLFLALCIIGFIILVATGILTIFTSKPNLATGIGIAMLGVVVYIIIEIIIMGYSLDITKFGIERSDEVPPIEVRRQLANGMFLLFTYFIYSIIPAIVTYILRMFLAKWLSGIIGLILMIIFSLALTMAECRLAKTDDIAEAINIMEAIRDISKVGIGKLIALTIIILILALVAIFLSLIVFKYNSILGAIVFALLEIYVLFFSNRSIGLLYSNI